MHERKKERERFLLDKFLEAAGLRPTGVAEREAPDFVIELDSRRVGVEVTELILESSRTGLTLRAQESLTDKITSNARRIYESKSKQSAFVSVSFFEPQISRKLRRDVVSEALAELVAALLSRGDRFVHWRNDYSDSSLDTIAFVSAHYAEEGRWSVARAGWVAPLTLAQVQSAVDRKNSELPRYLQAVPEVWLLIAIDSGRPSQFFEVDPGFNLSLLETGFERTYFFRTFPPVLLVHERGGA